MALRPRQLADEIEATLAEGRFSSLRRMYDDMHEPRARIAHAAEALLGAAEALPQQWESQLGEAQRELAIELQREARIRQEREARIVKYQEELVRLERALAQTQERERAEAAVLALRGQNSVKALQLISGAKHGGLTPAERRQRAALQFAQHLPLDIERARARCKTPARAWRSVALLCCATPDEPFAPVAAQYPAIEQYLAPRGEDAREHEREHEHKAA